MKILIVRNDKLGDFILSLPVFFLIKKYIPDIELHAFVPEYTREIAEHCDQIDKVILDPGSDASFSEQLSTLKNIRENKYDAIISLYSTTRVGLLAFLSAIKYRLAPATKLAQIFYNHRLTQRRSRSLKPEFEYNLDLAKEFLSHQKIASIVVPQTPFIYFPENEIKLVREQFYIENNLTNNTRLIFIHPCTGGSATNLNLQQYADLANNLKLKNNYSIAITAGPGEVEFAKQLSQLLKSTPHIVYSSSSGLLHFTKIIQLCDLFISASTGPLHIAGALNKATAAFYQRRRSATALRWQTLSSEDKRLAFTPPEYANESDLQKIDVAAAAKQINAKFLLT